jgi:hypothetical protein
VQLAEDTKKPSLEAFQKKTPTAGLAEAQLDEGHFIQKEIRQARALWRAFHRTLTSIVSFGCPLSEI